MGLDKQTFTNVGTGSTLIKDVHEIREMVKEAVADLNGLFNAFIQHSTSLRQPKSILEMAKCYDQSCDLLIQASRRHEALDYVSGKLNLVYGGGDQFSCGAELYFQDKAEKWVVKKAGSGQLPISHLSAEAQDELRREGTISFEIFDPETA